MVTTKLTQSQRETHPLSDDGLPTRALSHWPQPSITIDSPFSPASSFPSHPTVHADVSHLPAPAFSEAYVSERGAAASQPGRDVGRERGRALSGVWGLAHAHTLSLSLALWQSWTGTARFSAALLSATSA